MTLSDRVLFMKQSKIPVQNISKQTEYFSVQRKNLGLVHHQRLFHITVIITVSCTILHQSTPVFLIIIQIRKQIWCLQKSEISDFEFDITTCGRTKHSSDNLIQW